MEKIGVPAMNARIRAILKEFDKKSEVYQRAQAFAETHIDKEYLKYNKDGNFIGISQKKGAPDTIYGEEETLDEYLPTVTKVYKDVIEYYKQEDPSNDLASASVKQVRNTDALKKGAQLMIEKAYADLNDFKTIKSEIYQVSENKQNLRPENDPTDLVGRAGDLVSDIEHTQTWVMQARQIITQYTEAAQKQIREEMEQQYGK